MEKPITTLKIGLTTPIDGRSQERLVKALHSAILPKLQILALHRFHFEQKGHLMDILLVHSRSLQVILLDACFGAGIVIDACRGLPFPELERFSVVFTDAKDCTAYVKNETDQFPLTPDPDPDALPGDNVSADEGNVAGTEQAPITIEEAEWSSIASDDSEESDFWMSDGSVAVTEDGENNGPEEEIEVDWDAEEMAFL